VAETVEATKVFGKSWASGLLNAILRQQIRDKKPMPEITLAHYEHPDWLINALKQAYGKDWQIIAQQNVLAPPMHIRINRQKVSREQYLNLLQQAGIVATASDLSPDGITLQQGIDVNHLPKFAEGWVSVQDLAAQMAAILLQTQAGQHVLDACAAPGGKTAHILEMVQCNMLALDVDPVRLQRVADNLTRLQLTATFKAADAAAVDSWWDGQLFDRILLDAPCSATGVIRRHPEIRLSRTAAEVQVAANIQQKLLQALWPTLKPGGILLYATCSVLPAENDQQIEQLLQAQTDAKIIPIELPVGRKTQHGWQFLPTENGPDGFYYAKLQKQP
jgi:16S rRNA (cytosine967-C5)-methyltransferase